MLGYATALEIRVETSTAELKLKLAMVETSIFEAFAG